MRRTITTLVLSIAGLGAFAAPVHAGATPPDSTAPAGIADKSAPVDEPETTFVAEPTDTEPAAPAESEPTDTSATAEIGAAPAGSAVVVVDESGSELAALTVANVEPAWTGYGEGNDPESGHEYLRVTVVVESRSPRGLFAVDAGDFILQDADGFVTGANVEPTAEQAAAEEEPVSGAELPNTETVELALTFEVVSGIAPTAVFYAPSSDQLVTVHSF